MKMVEAFLRILVAGLASYRITRLIIKDDGPFMVFDKVRSWAGVYEVGDQGVPQSELGYLFSCVYCMGMYVAGVVLVLGLLKSRLGNLFIAWMAITGLQSFMEDQAQ